jgi:hypothetical protein
MRRNYKDSRFSDKKREMFEPRPAISDTRTDSNDGAEGGSRTRTPGGHHPLKMARLPVPPLRHFQLKLSINTREK